MIKIGLIINPIAGVGGSVGLKGSDGKEIQKLAMERGAKKLSQEKAKVALMELKDFGGNFTIYTAPNEMGENVSKALGFNTIVIGEVKEKTTFEDTENIAKEMKSLSIDYLLFAGGDGTARNIYKALGEDSLPAIGIPAGVKIHSGVYANTPTAAGKAILACLNGNVSYRFAEVMDIDEDLYRKGQVQAKLFGYLKVPSIKNIMQNPKAASRNDENDVNGICIEIEDRIKKDEDIYYIFGAGSTVKRITNHLGYDATLLGIDVVYKNEFILKDATEKQLLEITKKNKCRLIITIIGGQGHIFGRGNQQLSPDVIRQIGLNNIWIVAAAGKIYSLPSQTLFVDTGDNSLNDLIRGYIKVIVGWQETLVCKVM